MEGSCRPSGSLPQFQATHQSVFSICACFVCFPWHEVPHSYMLHVRDILSYLKSSMTHLCGMSGSPRKTYMEQNNMHDSFSPLRKKCSRNVWGETDLSDPQGRCEHLPQSSRGCQEEEEEKDETSSHHFLKWGCTTPALPRYPLTHAGEKGQEW